MIIYDTVSCDINICYRFLMGFSAKTLKFVQLCSVLLWSGCFFARLYPSASHYISRNIRKLHFEVWHSLTEVRCKHLPNCNSKITRHNTRCKNTIELVSNRNESCRRMQMRIEIKTYWKDNQVGQIFAGLMCCFSGLTFPYFPSGNLT